MECRCYADLLIQWGKIIDQYLISGVQPIYITKKLGSHYVALSTRVALVKNAPATALCQKHQAGKVPDNTNCYDPMAKCSTRMGAKKATETEGSYILVRRPMLLLVLSLRPRKHGLKQIQ